MGIAPKQEEVAVELWIEKRKEKYVVKEKKKTEVEMFGGGLRVERREGKWENEALSLRCRPI